MMRKIPDTYRTREYKDANALIALGELNNHFLAMGFSGRRSKPDFHFRFKTVERLEEYVSKYLKSKIDAQKYKLEQADKKKAFINPLKVGDIVYSSWGWEQTNVTFYQIVESIGRITVKVRRIAGKVVDQGNNGFMSGSVIARKDEFLGSEILTKRVSPLGDRCCITINSYETAFPWDGKPKDYTSYA